jgi:hypothetical protein
MDIYERLHKIATFFMNEMGEMGVEEVTVSSKLFDQILHHSFTGVRLFLHSKEKTPPIDAFTMNIYGRPVLVKRGRK